MDPMNVKWQNVTGTNIYYRLGETTLLLEPDEVSEVVALLSVGGGPTQLPPLGLTQDLDDAFNAEAVLNDDDGRIYIVVGNKGGSAPPPVALVLVPVSASGGLVVGTIDIFP